VSTGTEQATLDALPETLVELPSDDAEKLHRPVATTTDHAMPACDPSGDGAFVERVVADLDADELCNSPQCFGGER